MASFLTLPAEVREVIYHLVFEDSEVSVQRASASNELSQQRSVDDLAGQVHYRYPTLKNRNLVVSHNNCPALCLTCSCCYHEGYNIFLESMTIGLSGSYCMRRLIKSAPMAWKKFVTKIRIAGIAEAVLNPTYRLLEAAPRVKELMFWSDARDSLTLECTLSALKQASAVSVAQHLLDDFCRDMAPCLHEMMGPVYAKFPNVDIKISGCVSIEPLGDVSYKDADPLQVYDATLSFRTGIITFQGLLDENETDSDVWAIKAKAVGMQGLRLALHLEYEV